MNRTYCLLKWSQPSGGDRPSLALLLLSPLPAVLATPRLQSLAFFGPMCVELPPLSALRSCYSLCWNLFPLFFSYGVTAHSLEISSSIASSEKTFPLPIRCSYCTIHLSFQILALDVILYLVVWSFYLLKKNTPFSWKITSICKSRE